MSDSLNIELVRLKAEVQKAITDNYAHHQQLLSLQNRLNSIMMSAGLNTVTKYNPTKPLSIYKLEQPFTVFHKLLPKSDTRVAFAVQYIWRSNNYSINFKELASMFSIKDTSLQRRFYIAINLSPVQVKQILFVKKIKQDLATGMKISVIAAKYDFCDEYFMSRTFKKIAGVSPRNYKNGLNKHNT